MATSWTIGSGDDCDLVVARPTVSGHHCRLTRDADGYLLEDLGSTNGTFVNGRRVTAGVRVTRDDAITLGQSIPMPWPAASETREVRRTIAVTPTLAGSPTSVVVTIGREPDNDYVVNLPSVSGHHARIVRGARPGEAWIEDLGSSNGTAIGSPDRKVARALVTPADTIFLGVHPIPAAPLLERLDPSPVPSLTLTGAQAIIGRDRGCDRVIDVPAVSGRHARLVRTGDRVLIEDLGSSNGTFVNGQRVSRAMVVRPGDLIGLGGYTLVFAEGPRAAGAGAGGSTVAIESPVGFAAPPPILVGETPRAGSGWAAARDGAAILDRPWRVGVLLAEAPLAAVAIVAARNGGLAEGRQGVAAALSWLALAALGFGLSGAVVAGPPAAAGSRAARGPGGAARSLVQLAVLVVLGAIQCLVAWLIVSQGTGLAGPAPSELGLLVLAAAVGAALGQAIVSLAPRRPAAWAIVVPAMLALWLLGGQPWPIPRMAPWARPATAAAPSRWAFEGLLLLESRQGPAEPKGPARGDDLAETYFPADSARMGIRADAIALAAMLIGLAATAALIAEGPSRPGRPAWG